MPIKNSLRVGLDCRLAGSQHAGIGRYTENLLRELLNLTCQPKLQNRITWILFFYDRTQAQEVLGSLLKSDNVEVIYAPIRHYSLREQLQMPAIFRRAKLSILHIPHFNLPIFYRGKLVITIHDLLWHQQKGLMVTTLNPIQYFLKYLAYRYVSSRAVRQAGKILVPSQTIKETVLRYYPQVAKKIVLSPEGLAPVYQAESKKTQLPVGRVKKQLVYTGSLYPHKNLSLVIKALSKLPRYKLLIVGARSVFRERTKALVARYKVKQQVKFLGYLKDEALLKLYQQSLALVQPSLSEGFGLTGLEAMASKTLVLASDISVFREIYGPAAFYFDPQSVDAFLQALHRAELSKRKEQLKLGLKIAKQYNWQQLAHITCKTYLELI